MAGHPEIPSAFQRATFLTVLWVFLFPLLILKLFAVPLVFGWRFKDAFRASGLRDGSKAPVPRFYARFGTEFQGMLAAGLTGNGGDQRTPAQAAAKWGGPARRCRLRPG